MTPEMVRRLRPTSQKTLDILERARGRPPTENPKQAVSLRLDRDVIEHFKEEGPGWQSRINAALRAKAKLGRRAD
ncbi:MAG: BrnA antitoxin family protein [Terricaulis sp.]